MKKVILGLLVLGLTTQSYAQIVQVEELSEVIVTAVNYKYLNAADSKDIAVPVKLLQRKAAAYDVKASDLYDDDYDYYTVSFFIPEGKIVAVYDDEGKILKTIEKFKDIRLPDAVGAALIERFPNWTVVDDVYIVKYSDKKGANKTYKLKLENGDKRMKVKVDETGAFL